MNNQGPRSARGNTVGEDENSYMHLGQPYTAQIHWQHSENAQIYPQSHRPMPDMYPYSEGNVNSYPPPGTHVPFHGHNRDPGINTGVQSVPYPPGMQASPVSNRFSHSMYISDMSFDQQVPANANIPHAYPQTSTRPLVTTTRRTSQGTIPFSYQTATAINVDTGPQPPGDEHRLYTNYRRRATPRKFFTFGKVFLTLWSEPAGDSVSDAPSGHSMPSAYSAAPPSTSSAYSNGRYGEQVFSKIRRFVVIRPGDESCTAVPINTYRQQGAARRGIRKSEHAIVYSGKRAPQPLPAELPSRDEEGLLPQAIRVDLDQADEKLDLESRIDFGKVYTIEHKAKVRSLGKVNRDSEQAFTYQFEIVWARTMRPKPTTPITPSSSRSLSSIPEVTGAHRVLDWVQAFAVLTRDGWPEDRARAVLKEDPRHGNGLGTKTNAPEDVEVKSNLPDKIETNPVAPVEEKSAQVDRISISLPVRVSKPNTEDSVAYERKASGHAKKDSLIF